MARCNPNLMPVISRLVSWVFSLLLLSGCALPQRPSQVLMPGYRARNVFLWSSALPSHIRRVALLPMTCDPSAPDMVDARDVLQPIVVTELAKLRRFETVAVSPEMLGSRTGQKYWGCEEALPHNLFSWLSDGCGCDAVLFSRLTVFRGYAPLAVGWRMRLVDLRTGATLWAGDEVFDASQPSIQAGARRFQHAGRQTCAAPPDEWIIENSPRQFGQYAAAQLLGTLPGL